MAAEEIGNVRLARSVNDLEIEILGCNDVVLDSWRDAGGVAVLLIP